MNLYVKKRENGMKVDVLISCMNQTDFTIIDKSNLSQAHVVVVNQNKESNSVLVRNERQKMVNTTTKGLSVSRNMAVGHSDADICLIADDDEIFVNNVCDVVRSAYEKYVDADVIIFKIANFREKFHGKTRKLKKIDLLKVSSQQISFKRDSIKNVQFDINLGAGTPNGAGEENKFLLDCKKQGLKILYVPLVIAEVVENSGSTWFDGYNEHYFFNRGRTTRYIYGFAFSLIYAIYFAVIHKKDIQSFSRIKAFRLMVKGILKNDIGKEKTKK